LEKPFKKSPQMQGFVAGRTFFVTCTDIVIAHWTTKAHANKALLSLSAELARYLAVALLASRKR
jgi:hypothetical protein